MTSGVVSEVASPGVAHSRVAAAEYSDEPQTGASDAIPATIPSNDCLSVCLQILDEEHAASSKSEQAEVISKHGDARIEDQEVSSAPANPACSQQFHTQDSRSTAKTDTNPVHTITKHVGDGTNAVQTTTRMYNQVQNQEMNLLTAARLYAHRREPRGSKTIQSQVKTTKKCFDLLMNWVIHLSIP